MVFDVSILNGTIVDGTGKPRYRADVGISSGRVEAIGRLSDAETERRIDAAGHVVAPGMGVDYQNREMQMLEHGALSLLMILQV